MRLAFAIGVMVAMIVGCGTSATASIPSVSAAPTPASDGARWAEVGAWARGDFQTSAAALDRLYERAAAFGPPVDPAQTTRVVPFNDLATLVG